MIVDYEKLKQDLNFKLSQNTDLNQNLSFNLAARRQAEDSLLQMTKDFDDFKNRVREQQAGDSREIGSLHCKVRELQQRLDSSE